MNSFRLINFGFPDFYESLYATETEQRPHISLDYAVARAMGGRPHQEDEYSCVDHLSRHGGPAFFGVYDGHGSDYYSAHASIYLYKLILERIEHKHGKEVVDAITRGFKEEDKMMLDSLQLKRHLPGGCTATVAVVHENELYVANVGDSRAVLAIEEDGKWKAVRISRDHKPDDPDEKARIEKAGGVVFAGRVQTEETAINMSRALGDHSFKAPFNQALGDFITAVPYVAPPLHLTRNVKCLIIASDGLWNQLEDQQVVDLIHLNKDANLSLAEIADGITKECAAAPVSDNTTLILVFFGFGTRSESRVAIRPPDDAIVLRDNGDELVISKHTARRLQQ